MISNFDIINVYLQIIDVAKFEFDSNKLNSLNSNVITSIFIICEID